MVPLDVYGLVRPKLRGLVHAWSAVPVGLAALVLLVVAPSLQARISVAVYGVGITGMLVASALYHRLRVSQAIQAWLRKIDHSMIGVAVAATYTPVIVLTLEGSLMVTMLAIMWCGAIGTALLALLAPDAPRWMVSASYVILGWAGVVVVPWLWRVGGVLPFALVLLGGVLYCIGAVIYAKRKPNFAPGVFGFHELFHSFVVAAVVSQFVAIAVLVART